MRKFIYRLIIDFINNDVIGTAAQTAFYLTLSIPPLLALVISLSSGLTVSNTLLSVLGFVFPENVSEILNDLLLVFPKSAKVTVISAVGVIFSASGSTWALMRGIHKAFMRKRLRFTAKNRFIATVFTVVLILTVVVSLGSVVVGSVLSALFETLSADNTILNFSKRALAVIGVYAFVHSLYRFTPGVRLDGKELFWGSLFSACGWVLASTLFGTYIKYFTRYTTVYGGIGAFFILILWLFVISVIILVGAHINGVLLERK